MPIKVVIADDHEVVRRGLVSLLAGSEVKIVGEAASGEEALDLAIAHAGEIDLMISDVVMPGMQGPELLKAARDGGKGDDLELIWGVGPKLAAMLNRMGVYHFDQIAAWNDMNLAWVDQNLEGFKGRAKRDDWIGQAKKLATGWRPSNSAGDKPAE